MTNLSSKSQSSARSAGPSLGLFDFSPSAVFALDVAGCLVYVNDTFCEVVGQSPQQLTLLSLDDLGQEPNSPLWTTIQTKRPWQGQLTLNVAGQVLAGLVALTPVLSRSGECLFVLGTSDALGDAADAPPISRSAPLVLVVDLDGTILFIDRTVPGVSREEAIGAKIYAFMPMEHHDRIRDYLEQVVDTRAALSYEVPSVGPHGSVLVYETHIGPIEREGQVVALSFVSWEVAGTDIEVQSRHRMLAEASVEALVIHEDGEIIDVNQASCELFGYALAEMIGQPVARLFAPRSRALIKREAAAPPQTFHDATAVHASGTKFPVEVCSKTVPHPRGLSAVLAIREGAVRSPTVPRAPSRRGKAQEPIELSERELDVLELLAQGLTNREVSERIQVSARTVDHHVSHILGKLGVPNRTAAAMAARRKGLLRQGK